MYETLTETMHSSLGELKEGLGSRLGTPQPWRGLQAWVDCLYKHIDLSRYSHYPLSRPPAKFSPHILSPILSRLISEIV